MLIVETLEWMLSTVKRDHGFKSKVVVLTDGSTCQNWSKDVFHSIPNLAVEYRGNDELQSFRAIKSVSGHSKGFIFKTDKLENNISHREIDGSHSDPKEKVRNYIRRSAVSYKAGAREDGDSLFTTGFESSEDIVSFLRQNAFYNVVRENQIPDSKGFKLYMRSVKAATPEG